MYKLPKDRYDFCHNRSSMTDTDNLPEEHFLIPSTKVVFYKIMDDSVGGLSLGLRGRASTTVDPGETGPNES